MKGSAFAKVCTPKCLHAHAKFTPALQLVAEQLLNPEVAGSVSFLSYDVRPSFAGEDRWGQGDYLGTDQRCQEDLIWTASVDPLVLICINRSFCKIHS